MNAGPGFQRGVALITAMLIVAVATLLAGNAFWSSNLDRRRAENLLYADQAQMYALGGEAWAIDILRQDRVDSDYDYLGEVWAVALPPLPIEGGFIEGLVEDLQGRFNLNNLADATGQIDAGALEQLQRLLEVLEIDLRVSAAIADWIDRDVEPTFPDGAEDDIYTGRNPAYRSGNTPVTSVSELLAVEGVDTEVYELLRPYVAALPAGTLINVNTASAPVLYSTSAELNLARAESIVEQAAESGFTDLKDLDNLLPAESLPLLSVSTRFFRVTTRVTLGTTVLTMYSLLERDDQGRIWTRLRNFATE